MPQSSRVAIGQLRVASQRLEIESGRHSEVPRAEGICKLRREEVEIEEHFVCRWRSYTHIRDRYETLFRGQPILREIMDSRDHRQLRHFLIEIQRHRDALLRLTHAPTQVELEISLSYDK
ncbi:hypothetical protein KP509_12G000500 [Ceratopteris richardii]|uniref:Uncharacterized protein n=1 Tax=Ceratopteris richardii TaxID=49495 RepID=A0A8T2TI08_CERRI|nr:hypothetical protein KP509_12G000500 [Ceratopteris richardii]